MILPRLTLSQVALRRIVTVLDAPTSGFVALGRLAGLDPARDFRGAVLDGVDFDTDDLAGFDFSGADLTGADLSLATGLDQIITDANTRLPEHVHRRPSDFDIAEVRRMVLAGITPPKPWLPFVTELDLARTPITDLRPLSYLTALRILDLAYTRVNDLSDQAQARIFIGYASQDERIANRLSEALRGAGFRCWLPSPKTITAGSMPKWLDREIRASKVMLLVFTGSANRSKGLAKQLESARQSGLVVIPLRMGETPPHAHIDYQAGEAPWIDMLEDWGKGLGLLHSCLARVVPRETAPRPDAPNLVGPSSPLYQDGKCPSSCLSPLKNLTSLHSLSLTGTLIRDISPLSQLSALRYLDLRGTLVNDISAVTHVHIVKVDHGKRRALGRGKRGGRQVVMWRNRPLATITAVNSPP